MSGHEPVLFITLAGQPAHQALHPLHHKKGTGYSGERGILIGGEGGITCFPMSYNNLDNFLLQNYNDARIHFFKVMQEIIFVINILYSVQLQYTVLYCTYNLLKACAGGGRACTLAPPHPR